MNRKYISLAAILLLYLFVPSVVRAEMIEVSGDGKSTVIPDNNSATVATATRNAKREAINAAVMQLIGPSAPNDPKVIAAVEKIIVQIGDDKIVSRNASRDENNNYVVHITIRIDSLEFIKLMQTQGIAPTSDRLFKILVVMDEFFTTPTDKQKPLREVVQYAHDKTTLSEDRLSASSKASADVRASARDSSASSAKYAGSGRYDGRVSGDGYSAGVHASGQQTGSAAQRSDSAAAYSNKSAESSRLDTQSLDLHKDVVNFYSLVEYQPQNVGLEKDNLTYTALMREARKYDLAMMDNSVLRSTYFKKKALTIQEMDNSPELVQYVTFARKNNADYFMMGNTIIRDLGSNQCDGVVSIKAFSTDNNEILASEMRSEGASGTSPDDCRAKVAEKLAYFAGKTIGSSIKDYHRQREVSGKEYTVLLISAEGALTGRMSSSFSRGLANLKGLASKVNVRSSTDREYEVVLAYKGDVPFADAMGEVLDSMPFMNQADYSINGTKLTICLEGPKRCKQ